MRQRSAMWWVGLLLVVLALVPGCGGGQPDVEELKEPGETPKPGGPQGDIPAAAPAGSAKIEGTVTFSGQVPAMKTIDMSAEANCAKKHTEPARDEALVLGSNQTMGNILVHVKSGVAQQAFPAPTTPVVIDQDGCRYAPHVAGVMVGQPLKFLNSDGLLHNVHALPKTNAEFNQAMPATVTETSHTFSKPEPPFHIKCDVHPWMGAWVAVFGHPYFDVTATDGRFSVENLPAGTYEVEAWHERLGAQTATVTVGDGETKTNDFTFSTPTGG